MPTQADVDAQPERVAYAIAHWGEGEQLYSVCRYSDAECDPAELERMKDPAYVEKICEQYRAGKW